MTIIHVYLGKFATLKAVSPLNWSPVRCCIISWLISIKHCKMPLMQDHSQKKHYHMYHRVHIVTVLSRGPFIHHISTHPPKDIQTLHILPISSTTHNTQVSLPKWRAECQFFVSRRCTVLLKLMNTHQQHPVIIFATSIFSTLICIYDILPFT